jgi:nitric oxide reductase NorQ protein
VAEPARGGDVTVIGGEPYYAPIGNERAVFEECHRRRLAVMLKGPTGCGKTRFVEHMAHRLGRPLVTVACHDDLSASDLIGRFLIRDDGTHWQDGPLARAVRAGGICYLDEIVEARQDTVVILHALTDYRRILPLDKTGEEIHAPPGFMLVVSYNPGYQHLLKDLKPSTRQRFVALTLGFAPFETEVAVVAHEGGVSRDTAHMLVTLAGRLRGLRDQGLAEVPSTRLLVAAAQLIAGGIPPREACRAGLIAPLSDEPTLVEAMEELVDLTLD